MDESESAFIERSREVDMEVIINNESKLVIVYMCPLQLPIFFAAATNSTNIQNKAGGMYYLLVHLMICL
jgi:hypothetical protein